MFKTRISKKTLITAGIITAFLATGLLSGCSKKPAGAPPQTVQVKAMQVIQKDTPVSYEFVGQVAAQNEVKVQARVSGNIVAKMVSGGATVYKGQPLFTIDRRQYDTALLNRQAQAAQAQASLSQARRDLVRYQSLYDQQAIPQQTLDNSVAQTQQFQAQVDANQALVQQAQLDLSDTVITSPLDGRIDIQDLSVGSYVQAGTTILATVSSVDPINVLFSISENEYIQYSKIADAQKDNKNFGTDLELVLSDGSIYPLQGRIDQVNRSLSQETGTLSIKALFENPQHLLVPGMFARVRAKGEIRSGALLVPQRAIQELLGKNFVTIVGAEDKAESRPVKLGPKVGNMVVIEEGLNVSDKVIVEGFIKTPPGTPLQVVMMQPEELQIPAKK